MRQPGQSARVVCGLLILAAAPLAAVPVRAADVSVRPAGFVENRGQADPSVLFLGSSVNGAVYFTPGGPLLQLRQLSRSTAEGPGRERERRPAGSWLRFAVGLRPVGGNPAPRVEGIDPLPGRYRRLAGPEGRATEARAFAAVAYRDLWPGIDLIFRNDGGSLTYRFVAAPGAEPSRARLTYDGARAVRETAGGYLLETPLGTLFDRRPDGLDPWGAITLAAPAQDPSATAGTAVESAPSWGSFLGGGDDDAVYSMVLDDMLRPIVAGVSFSIDLPTTPGVLETSYDGGGDAFVAQFDEDGRTLLWSTFLGGDGDDRAWVVRRDRLGRIVVGGVTSSAAFPTTPGAFDVTPNGGYDGFVAKLKADGSTLVWSTLYGGADREWDLSGLEIDRNGAVVFCGSTRSNDLPITPGALDGDLSGVSDAFVARLSPDGGSLLAATYLGGDGFEAAEDLALDSEGRAVVTGWTLSDDFPVTAGAFQTARAGDAQDVFVGRLAVDAGTLDFGTLVGGGDLDEGFGIALDPAGAIVIVGRTDSADFPVTAGCLDPTFSGSFDAFVASLAPDGGSLNWATFLGGTGGATGLDVVLDTWKQPVVAGWTCGDFPVGPAAYDASFNGVCDGFLARLSAGGDALVYGSYVGGWGDDAVYALALDPASHPVLAGETDSPDFPVATDGYDPSHADADGYDGFVVSLPTAVHCVQLVGDTLTITKAVQATCPAGTPAGPPADVIEGDVSQLGPTTIGNVRVIACATSSAILAANSTPEPGEALFLLARTSPGGSYTDAAGPGLVGDRIPLGAACP